MDERGLVQIMIDRLLQRLVEEFGENLVSAVLYGSVARGDFRPDSDIDLLLVFEELPLRRFARFQLIYPLLQEAERSTVQDWKRGQGHRFSIILKTREEACHTSRYYVDMTTDAVLLYDRDGFFGSVLDQLRARMKELGSRKITIGDRWYWDWKPDYRFGEIIEL